MNTKQILDNYYQTYKCATYTDKQTGLSWYYNAHIECSKIASRYKIPTARACAVTAALSPRLRWDVNLQAADKLIDLTLSNLPMRLLPNVLGRSKRNAANALLKGPHTLSGNKVVSFYHNLLLPNDDMYTTIDTWMIKAAQYPKINITTKDYKKLSNALIHLAADLDYIPCQLQAILWLSIQRTPTALQLALPLQTSNP